MSYDKAGKRNMRTIEVSNGIDWFPIRALTEETFAPETAVLVVHTNGSLDVELPSGRVYHYGPGEWRDVSEQRP